MTEKSYNGWTNYETWLVAWWIDNEQGSYQDRCSAADEYWTVNRDKVDRSVCTRIALSDWIRDYVTDMIPDSVQGFISDLVNSALSEVDWNEIADNWLSETEGYESREP